MPHATQSQTRQETQQPGTRSNKPQINRIPGSEQGATPSNTNNNHTHSTPAPHARHKRRRAYHLTDGKEKNLGATRIRRLATVNGVVTPSKVPPGQLPDQGQGKDFPDINHSFFPCSICTRKFSRKDYVKNHMWSCVQKNGNPNGVQWDDAWKAKVNKTGSSDLEPNGSGQDVDPDEIESETEPVEDEKTDKLQPVDYSLPSSPSGGLPSQPFMSFHPSPLHVHPTPPSTSNIHQTSPTPSASDPAPSHLPQHSSQPASPTLSPTTSQIASPPSVPYNENLRMDILSNEALLLTVQAWQDTAQHVGEEYVMDHPQFQSVMDELWQRGLVDEESNWLIDVQKVDGSARRVVP